MAPIAETLGIYRGYSFDEMTFDSVYEKKTCTILKCRFKPFIFVRKQADLILKTALPHSKIYSFQNKFVIEIPATHTNVKFSQSLRNFQFSSKFNSIGSCFTNYQSTR